MRLTNSIRDQIANTLIARRFDPLEAGLLEEKRAVADMIYRLWVSVELEKILDKANQIEPGATHSHDTISVLVKGWPRSENWKMSVRRSSPAFVSNPKLSEHPEIEQLASDIHIRESEMKSEKGKARQQAMAALNTCNTFKQLEQAWPDVMPIANRFRDEPEVKNLPSLPVADLNNLFELPEEQREAA